MDELKQKIITKISEKLDGPNISAEDLKYLASAWGELTKDWIINVYSKLGQCCTYGGTNASGENQINNDYH